MSDAPAGLRNRWFGLIALEQGYITERQLDDAIEVGRKMAELGMDEDMSRILVKKNYLTGTQAEQVETLLADRVARDPEWQFCRVAIEDGRIGPDDLLRGLRAQRREREKRRLSEVLVELEILTDQERLLLEKAHRRVVAQQSADETSKLLQGLPNDLEGVPSQLGNYEIVEELSRGGMGVVYRARQRSLNRIVALKILSSDLVENQEFIERFHREAKAIGELSHPNIVQIYDYGRIRGLHYIAMEFVDGESLEALLLRKGALSVANAAIIAESVARGLAEANKRGVIHRDVKPDNILIAKNGQIKLTDFGLAKIEEASGQDSGLTQRGSFMGSPYYIAPEQARGEEIDFRVDMYSLGVTLYRVLVGEVPFDAPTSIQIIAKHLNGSIPARGDLPREIPIPAYNLIKWLMAKKPEGRPESWRRIVEIAREMRDVSDVRQCPHCASPLKPGDVICIQCGMNLKTGVQIQIQLEGEGTGRKRRAGRPDKRTESRADTTSSVCVPVVDEEALAREREETQPFDAAAETQEKPTAGSVPKRRPRNRRFAKVRPKRKRRSPGG